MRMTMSPRHSSLKDGMPDSERSRHYEDSYDPYQSIGGRRIPVQHECHLFYFIVRVFALV